MIELLFIIFIPFAAGLLMLALPKKAKLLKGLLAVGFSAVSLVFSFLLYEKGDLFYSFIIPNLNNPFSAKILEEISGFFVFNVDSIARLLTILTCVFAFFISVYSLSYITNKKKAYNFFPYVLMTLGASTGALLCDNLLLFLIFYGILGVTTYKLISGHDEESAAAAKKSLVMIGASDVLILLGIVILWKITGTLSIFKTFVGTNSGLEITAFICLAIGSFTKAGAFPFHTWIPDYAKKAPASSSAYIPAALDKLVGIYLLGRICTQMFLLNEWLTFILVAIGVLTIIIAVMMALVQHNYKKLLGYHAVSQVGYMVLGFGLGSPIGIAGGLFHMINNAIYKSGLFLVAGSVEKRTGKEDLESLGGLSRVMPITFVTALIFSLSISGVPPFNGFASKWVIYQAIVDFGQGAGIANKLWVIWLSLAVLGSALTLASFMKFMSGIFLGRKIALWSDIKEVSILMWMPKVLLALGCIVLGIFPVIWVLPEFIMPYSGEFSLIGIWNSPAITILVLVSIFVGFVIYWIGDFRKFRIDDSFIGGEVNRDAQNFSVLDFYKTISNFKLLSPLYRAAEKKLFDIYDWSKNIIFWFGQILSRTHAGILPLYILWVIGGLLIILLLLIPI